MRGTRGNRIIFDGETGAILHQTGEMAGDGVAPHGALRTIGHVDLEYGEIDFAKWDIIGVDTTTLKPILVEKPIHETEEQKRIRELEDALLLQTENEIGGIL